LHSIFRPQVDDDLLRGQVNSNWLLFHNASSHLRM